MRSSMVVTALVAALAMVGCGTQTQAAERGGIEIKHADLHSRVGARILATITTPGAKRVRVLLTDPTGKTITIADRAAPSTPNARIAVLSLRKSIPGQYVLKVQACTSKGRVIATKTERFTRAVTGMPKVGFDENNALVLAGRPYFPVGVWMPHFETGSQASLAEMSAGRRVNTAVAQGNRHTGADNGPAFAEFLDACSGLQCTGIGLARGGDYDADVPTLVAHGKDSPALLAWMWIDEPEYNDVSPEQSREWTEQAHAADPDHPVLINLVGAQFVGQGGKKSTARRYTSDLIEAGRPLPADWISTDYYPIAFSKSFHTSLQASFDNFAAHLSTVRSWTKDLYPTATFIETASQPGLGSTAVPTPTQVWAETWIAVIRGAKGIIWFPHSGSTDVGTAAIQAKATAYLTRFAPVLAKPDSSLVKRTHLTGSRVDVMTKEYKGKLYVFAVNRNVKSKARVRFTVSGAKMKRVEVYGEGRTIKTTKTKFTDSFKPYAVHIYIFKRRQ